MNDVVARCRPQDSHRLVQLPAGHLLSGPVAQPHTAQRSRSRHRHQWPCKACAPAVGVWGGRPGHWLLLYGASSSA